MHLISFFPKVNNECGEIFYFSSVRLMYRTLAREVIGIGISSLYQRRSLEKTNRIDTPVSTIYFGKLTRAKRPKQDE